MMTGIIKSINAKNKLYKQFCQATNSTRRDIHQKFKSYRYQIVTLSCLCKENYFKTYFENNKKDPKRIWYGIKTQINTTISKTGSHHITLNRDNKTTSDDFIIANHFNSFFRSIAGKLLKKVPKAKKTFSSFLTKNIYTKTFFLSPTTAEEIEDVIKTFNLNKAIGPNSIPVTILKEIKKEISEPLSTLINLSFDTGDFPNCLKLSKVIPVYKKGDQQECGNCRPISLLSNISKLIEKLLYYRLHKF